MLNTKQIESLVDKVSDILPSGLGELPDNMQKNIKMTLSSALAKMDLVTREEFDIQKAVLTKTRQKCDLLEQKLTQLESSLTDPK